MKHCVMTDDARRALFGALRDHGYTDRWVRLAVATAALGRVIDTFTAISDADARRVIAALASTPRA